MVRMQLSGGYNLNLAGKPSLGITELLDLPSLVSVKAIDLQGIKPFMKVKVGDSVKAGDVLFLNKANHQVKVVAPFDGTVKEIKRGDRRVLLEVIIDVSGKQSDSQFKSKSIEDISEKDLLDHLLDTGSWPFFRQYPYNVVADPELRPRDIYVETLCNEPHVPDMNYVLQDQKEAFEKGIALLKKLTPGNVYTGLANTEIEIPEWMRSVKGTTPVYTNNVYPAGEASVQSYNVAPIKKNEVIWHINAQDLVGIVNLLETGKLDYSRVMTVAGSCVDKPQYVKTYLGSPVKTLTKDGVAYGENRYISGGIFTGTTIEKDGFLGFYGHSLHVIEEGLNREFLPFQRPGFEKSSFSRVFLSTFFGPDTFVQTSSQMGEERACIACSHCEEVCPVDIKPQFLFKSLLAEDYAMGESLGVKDCSLCGLCTYVCPSKIDLDDIISSAQKFLHKEG